MILNQRREKLLSRASFLETDLPQETRFLLPPSIVYFNYILDIFLSNWKQDVFVKRKCPDSHKVRNGYFYYEGPVKVTRSLTLMSIERASFAEYSCQIWSLRLLWFKSYSKGVFFATHNKTGQQELSEDNMVCRWQPTLNPDIRKRVLAVRPHMYGLRLINYCAI